MDDYSILFSRLEGLRKSTSRGVEHWLGRELQDFFEYSSWERFDSVVERARAACDKAAQNPSHHFHKHVKVIEAGKTAKLERSDWYLTRYACYLVAMNGDPSKPEIACAQTYFALQTRRQEIGQQTAKLDQRLAPRDRMKEANKALSSAAQGAGVKKFAVFHDAGYKGLYDGLGQADIKELKGISPKEPILDRMGSSELAANYFRATQAEEKILRDNVQGERSATDTHRDVGTEVREAIRRIGGVMPESLPAEPSIKKLERRRKKLLKSPDE